MKEERRPARTCGRAGTVPVKSIDRRARTERSTQALTFTARLVQLGCFAQWPRGLQDELTMVEVLVDSVRVVTTLSQSPCSLAVRWLSKPAVLLRVASGEVQAVISVGGEHPRQKHARPKTVTTSAGMTGAMAPRLVGPTV